MLKREWRIILVLMAKKSISSRSVSVNKPASKQAKKPIKKSTKRTVSNKVDYYPNRVGLLTVAAGVATLMLLATIAML